MSGQESVSGSVGGACQYLTVIMPTYNRAAILASTLDDFTKLDAPKVPWELIVVANACTDDTDDVVRSFAGRLPVRLVHESQAGKNYANNRGIQVAKGDVLVFTDDDVTPRADWLTAVVSSVAEWPEFRVFGGRVVPRFPEGTSEVFRTADFASFVFGICDPGVPTGLFQGGSSPLGANTWMRRGVFGGGVKYCGAIGPKGKGRISGSELELFDRLRRDGEKFVFVQDAVVAHRIQSNHTTFRYVLKRACASGRGAVRIAGFEPDAICVFDMPLYRCKEFLSHAYFGLWRGLTLQRKKAAESFVQAAVRWGAVTETRRMRKDVAAVSK